MKNFWKQLLLCTLIALLSGNAAERSPAYEDIPTRHADFTYDDGSIDYRLPTSVAPVSYEIMLVPDLQQYFTFDGIVKIQAVVKSPTDTITLNVGNINITSHSVILEDDKNVYNGTFKHDEVTEKYTLSLSETLTNGSKVLIVLEYNGTLNDNSIGFYRSSYIDKNGQVKWLAATQFHATHARHAFPCFDEPSFKATFQIRITRQEHHICLSNMPLNKTEKLDYAWWDTFETSVPMSTYLVAFVVSEFHPLEQGDFKVWAKPDAVDQANYALKIGTAGLKILSDTFGLKYGLPKMDMVAVPDFAAGAMENWGLVMYRETRMLYDERESSALAQQTVASVVLHELTHMWFGNLVTPEWWSYLWLSEAFATYFQYFGTAEIEAAWSMKEQFVVEQHQAALITDSLESSPPMTRNVSSQSQIGGMGDSITYSKGASIVRMMSLVFGSNVFKPALRDYLQNNKEKGLVNPDALWTALHGQVNRAKPTSPTPVKTIMDSWTTQAGYPVVSVTVNGEGIRVTQRRFLLRNLEKTPTNVTWWVPLTWATQSKPNFNDTATKYWLDTKKHTINAEVNPKEWVIFNVQSSGFYRVNYDYDGWQRILGALNSNKFKEIHVLNRAAIVDDLLNLARTEYLNYEVALDGMTYLKRETNYLPFKAAFNGLDYLNKRLTGFKEYTLFKRYVLSLINERRKKLGYEDRTGDDRLTVLLRREINNWACNFDDKGCVTIYVSKFQKWRANTSISIKPNERTTAYCVAIRHGTPEDWEFLWKQYYNSNNADDQMVIINALGCSMNTTILERYLGYAISSYQTNRIRRQDSKSVFAAVYSDFVGAEYILDFVDKHYKEMEKYYGGQDAIATILDGASRLFSKLELVNRFQDFIEKHKTELASIRESLASSLKVARYELKWHESASVPIVRWLEAYNAGRMNTIEYRLPTNIKPRKYNISVTPHLVPGDFTFDGKVVIKADVVETSNYIILHSAEIKYKTLTVTADEKEVNSTIEFANKYDFSKIYLAEELKAGTNLIIEIEYTGHLNASELRGFYKSSYVDETGEKRWLAATQLEPVGARKLFPCFDEPAMKAQFTIQVTVPPGYHAFSNMKLADQIDKGDGNQLFVFDESVTMSTYLVAIVVSDFKYTSSVDDKIEYRVFARPNAISQTKYALSTMDVFVQFFENKFEQEYQIPKLDMVALPDFPSGAMENWGLLTYKETNLLYDEDHSSLVNQRTIRNVIAHEIAHQWFGNLVSPSWWKYVWLNEGFARYFQYHAPDEIYDDKTMEQQFIVDQVHSALSADSSNSTHAMSHDVYSPSEISSMFDVISYAKAASILRMIEKSYGSNVFYEALKDYLNKRQYDVATPDDLYRALQRQINEAGGQEDIKTILDTWTTQPGYPVIHVEFKRSTVILRQERFFIRKPKVPVKTIWHIPITWARPYEPNYRNTTPDVWLIEDKIEIRRQAGALRDLAVLNVMQSGFYRVNYGNEHWLRLSDFLKDSHGEINPINRAALIDDLMNLARAGHVDYRIVISFLTYLRKDRSYVPWRAFYNNLAYLNNRLRGRDMEDLFKTYLVSLIEPLYSRLGFDDEGPDTDSIFLDNLLRLYTREWACKLNIADCRFRAAILFMRLCSSKPTRIPPSYRGVVYCTAMRTDTTETAYNILWKQYLNSNVTVDKLVILSSLACSENRDILEKLLLAAVTENSDIRYQDSAKVFSNVYDASLIGVEVVMNVIQKHYDVIRDYFGDYTKIKSIVSSLASRLSTYNLYYKYRDLLDWLVEKEPAFKKSVDSFVANAEYEFEWYGREGPKIFAGIDSFLHNKNYRLPNTLHPELNNVSLAVDVENSKFEGNVQIYMRVEKNTSMIVLNSDNLDIVDVKVLRNYGVDGNDSKIELIPLLNHLKIPEFQQLKIYLREYANAEKIMVDILFNGTINNNMQGFYRSSYLDSSGKRHWLATTQFEPTHARKAFPCFDEPAFKSKFIINIARPPGYHTLSNMPLLKQVPSCLGIRPGYTCDVFHNTTKVMSPYLVAFVVSKFKSVESTSELINVWGRPEVAKHGSYAQNTASSLLSALQNYLFIDYPLPKLDLVGIPDFSMGAMENWGLATFREYGLFHSKNVTTGTYEKYIITVIAHELAHMWFGNLVTCQWWDYIWLNEGFAEYLQWVAADMILPSYKFMEQFVVYELQAALRKDSSPSAHPMTNPVVTADEINGIFDYVTYGKSSSVLRMVLSAYQGTVNQERSILRGYLKKYQDGTTRPEDLWEFFKTLKSLDGNVYENIAEMMDTWTNQPGYPVVHAKLNGSTLTLTQERFEIPRRFGSSEFYWIPIHIAKSADSAYIILESDLWLGPEPKTVFINPINEWFIVNYKQIGFYRVNYDILSWKRLIGVLDDKSRFESIHATSRAQIIDDLFHLALARYVDYDLVMNATKYLTHETNHLPWKAFFNGLSYVYERYETGPNQVQLTEYLLDLISAMYDKVGFDDVSDDQHLDELNREMILQWACKLNKTQCVERSLELFAAWRNDSSERVPRNARAAVYCTTMRNGTWDDWDFLWKQYLQTDFVSEKMVILNALGCSANETKLQNYLLTTIRGGVDGVIRKQDVKTVLASVYTASQLGVNVTLDFLIIYIEDLYVLFGNWDDVGNLFYEVASHISTNESLLKLTKFFRENESDFPEIRNRLYASINIAEDNLRWYLIHRNIIIDWINWMNENGKNRNNDGYAVMPLNVVFLIIVALIPYFLSRN